MQFQIIVENCRATFRSFENVLFRITLCSRIIFVGHFIFNLLPRVISCNRMIQLIIYLVDLFSQIFIDLISNLSFQYLFHLSIFLLWLKHHRTRRNIYHIYISVLSYTLLGVWSKSVRRFRSITSLQSVRMFMKIKLTWSKWLHKRVRIPDHCYPAVRRKKMAMVLSIFKIKKSLASDMRGYQHRIGKSSFLYLVELTQLWVFLSTVYFAYFCVWGFASRCASAPQDKCCSELKFDLVKEDVANRRRIHDRELNIYKFLNILFQKEKQWYIENFLNH